MKGKQIRATGFAAKMVEALGGTPVGAPQPEVYEMLAKGIVQGSWSSVDVLKSYKQAEVVKYLTLNDLYVSTFYVVMNLNKWRSLPSDVQKIIDDFSEKYIEINGAFWDKMHNEGLQYAKDSKLEIISLPPNELDRWKKAVQPLLDDYVARMNAQKLPGKEFLEEVMRLKEKYSK
jgi:TRAP-type C4-dicarboxylate transport system substrate-binding protein